MKHEESRLQQACTRWFDWQYPQYMLNFFSIPNEGARTPANGARMKAMGRRRGVADMCLVIPQKPIYNGLFIEFKIGKGKQSPEQIAFQEAVESKGYRYQIITNIDQFISVINEYLK